MRTESKIIPDNQIAAPGPYESVQMRCGWGFGVVVSKFAIEREARSVQENWHKDK